MSELINNESEMLKYGGKLFRYSVPTSVVIFLQGDLGAGKTTLVRGFLRESGYQGIVKSPTFTLVEDYQLANIHLIHFDLYRLSDAEELEWIGIRDYLDQEVVCFVEWADRGEGVLPQPDVVINIDIDGDTRIVSANAKSPVGVSMLHAL